VRIGIGINKKRSNEKNGIGIKIIGIGIGINKKRSNEKTVIAGNKISNCRLFETVLSAMVIIGTIGQIGDSKTMIDVSEPIRGRTSVHDRLGGRLSVHDSLGERVGHFLRNQEELEEIANARVPDEFIFCRDSNIHCVESKEIRYQPVWRTKLPRWCLDGLTRTQRRRMQREHQEDLYRELNSSKSEDRQQLDRKGKGPSADVNMVFMLSMKFLAPYSDEEEISLPDQIAQLTLDPMTAIFEKSSDDERQHLKALFVKTRVDGQPVLKILIDGALCLM